MTGCGQRQGRVARRPIAWAVLGVLAVACGDPGGDGPGPGGGNGPSGSGGLVARIRVESPVVAGTRVVLDGSESSGPSGMEYAWGILLTSTGGGALIEEPTEPVTSFVAARPSDYLIRLTVSDGSRSSYADVILTAYESPDNLQPIARSIHPRIVPVGATVELDGSPSYDPEQAPLTFTWTMRERPEGSAAEIADPSSERASFVADREGEFVVNLFVNDGELYSEPMRTTIEAVPEVPATDPPISNAGLDQIVPVGHWVSLDGSESHDPEGGHVRRLWSFVERPPGSRATIQGIGFDAYFIADAPGEYRVRVHGHNDYHVGDPDEMVVRASHPRLASIDLDAQHMRFSRPLDRLVLARGTRLSVVDAGTLEASDLTLPGSAQSISIAPDERSAAIGHDEELSIVDLEAIAHVVTHPVSGPLSEIVFADGVVHVIRSFDPWLAVRVSDGAITPVSLAFQTARTMSWLHPDGQRIYAGEYFRDLARLNLVDGLPEYAYRWPYSLGAVDTRQVFRFWLYSTGDYLLTQRGDIHHTTNDPGTDLTEAGKLSHAPGLMVHVDHSGVRRELAIVFTEGPGISQDRIRRQVFLYEDQGQRRAVVGLPQARPESPDTYMHARAAFYGQDEDRITIVLEEIPPNQPEPNHHLMTLDL